MVVLGSGFLSQDPLDLHFGLGRAGCVDRAEIVWPSERVQRLENLAADRVHRIRERE